MCGCLQHRACLALAKDGFLGAMNLAVLCGLAHQHQDLSPLREGLKPGG